MLETIREYALERLEESGEKEALRRRHAHHFLALAEEAEPHLLGSPKAWLERLDREHDNFRAALDTLEELGESQLLLRLGGALMRFWYGRGHLIEGRRRLESALRTDDSPTPGRAKALNAASVMAVNTRDTAAATILAEEALQLQRKLGDAWGTAYSLFLLGTASAEAGDFESAKGFFEDTLQRFRAIGDEHYTMLATDALAWTYGSLGDVTRRRQLHLDNLRRAREQSNERVVALSLDQLAAHARDDGGHEEALSMLQESLRIFRDHGDRGAIAQNFGRLAQSLVVAGRTEMAAQVLSSSEALREEVGGGYPWLGDVNEETRRTIRARLDESTFEKAWRAGQSLTLEQAVAFALAIS
jgi:tetratricopeptide (TPR) repeat protein